ncbi:MAG: DUF1592 domain-containing protein [Planctomycetes bacterium]|nr:DUF1592 domain-containing protein [Planctomycetota bacterium]
MRLLCLFLFLGLALAPGFAGGGLVAAEAEVQNGTAVALPPLSEARAAGRVKSSYLKNGAATTPPTSAGAPAANLAGFKAQLAPVFKTTCTVCHGADKQKGKFRVDTLDPDLLKGRDVEKWLKVYDVVSNGEMPPENDQHLQLDDPQRSAMVAWLGAELQKASQAQRQGQGPTSFRRMARYEYNYALQDLLGLPYEFVTSLPPESVSEDGFTNGSHMLQMSAMQLEYYRQIALTALRKATIHGDRPALVTYQIPMQEAMDIAVRLKEKEVDFKGKDRNRGGGEAFIVNRDTGKGVVYGWSYDGGKWGHKPDATPGNDPAVTPVVAVVPPGAKLMLDLGDYLPDEGAMRVRIRAARSLPQDRGYAGLRLIFGGQTSNNANFLQIVGAGDCAVTGAADQPQIIEFRVPLGEIPRNPFRKISKLGAMPNPAEVLTIQHVGGAGHQGDGGPLNVLIDYVEISAPCYEQWPPKTYTDIFVAGDRGNEVKYGRDVLSRFMARAWRRPVAAQEVDQYMTLFAAYRPSFTNLEDAMLEVMATVLTAPDFLYLTQRTPAAGSGNAKRINDFELASRLAMFLWCSIPDQELLDLARTGRLSDAQVLGAQVARLLADAKAQRFAQNFVRQWLGLDALDHLNVDMQQYHGVYDEALKDAMTQEPIAYFAEVLARDASIMDFIHADYAMVNERLARHYGLPAVDGPDFRRVAIDPASNRGGILTCAGVLAMNSDGKDSHPLKRGVWVLKRILDDPPPPPPPNVPQVDLTNPDILKMTLKERIADHRNKPACYSCHSRIDPWGVALENFDAVGAWRTAINGKPVDAKSALFNKQVLDGLDGLKRYLLADRQDQFARAVVHKLAVFALGRPLQFADRADLDKLTATFRAGGDRLRDLITLLVLSDLFQAK